MNTQHTPGPWTIRPVNWGYQLEYIDTIGFRSVVAECYTAAVCDEHGSAEANARLVAQAPDLLAALQAIVDCPDYRNININTHEMRAARAAIAKATTT